MHRRRFLASILGLATVAIAPACTRKSRRLHLGYDPGKPGADHAALVQIPPRHMMTSHVHVQRIEALGDDPDAFIRAFNAHAQRIRQPFRVVTRWRRFPLASSL